MGTAEAEPEEAEVEALRRLVQLGLLGLRFSVGLPDLVVRLPVPLPSSCDTCYLGIITH